MKNLQCIKDLCQVSAYERFSGGRSVSVCSDGPSGRVFLLNRTGQCICISTSTASVEWIVDINLSLETHPFEGGWFYCEYVVELSAVCCCHRDGTLVLVHTSATDANIAEDGTPTLSLEAVELIGAFDGGLCAACWSPDQSRLALVTGIHRILLLTPAWDVLSEIQVAPFQGEQAVGLSWRPDSHYLALSVVDSEGSCSRVLRVYDCSDPVLPLHATGRNEDTTPVQGLHASIGWSGDGQLIGQGQTVSVRNRVQVAFSETNGLRHREIVLQGHSPHRQDTPAPGASAPAGTAPAAASAGTVVTKIAWNSESDLLALELVCTGSEGQRWQSLSLWHRDNYHWSCQQEWQYGDTGPPPLPACPHGQVLLGWAWDRHQPHTMHLAVADSQGKTGVPAVRAHSMAFAWTYGADEAGSAGAVCAVDEAGGLRLSALAVAQVPPPYSYATLQLSTASGQYTQVRSWAWHPSGSQVVTGDRSVHTALACLTTTGHVLLSPVHILPPALANRSSAAGQRPAVPVSGGVLSINPSCKDDMGEVQLQGAALDGFSAPFAFSLLGARAHVSTGGDPVYLSAALISSLRLLTWIPSCSPLPGTTDVPRTATLLAAAPAALLGAEASGSTSTRAGALGRDSLLLLRVSWTEEGEGGPGRVHATAQVVEVPGEGRVAALTLSMPLTASAASQSVSSMQQGPQAGRVPVVHTWDGRVYALRHTHTGRGKVQETQAQAQCAPFTVTLDSLCTYPEPCHRLLCFSLDVSLQRAVQADIAAAGLMEPPAGVCPLLAVGLGSRTGRLYVHGANYCAHAAGSMGVHSEHGLLLHITPGPTPVLSVTHVSQLARLAYGLVPQGTPGAQQGGQAGSSGNVYAAHPLAAMLTAGAHIPAELLAQGVPLYAGASVTRSGGRALERGASLVTCIPAQDQVVVQAPRGNMETVVPRFLTMARLRGLLDGPSTHESAATAPPVPQWGEALETARKHRVDLNFLHDHSPAAFMHPAWLRQAVQQVSACVRSMTVGASSTSIVRKAGAGGGHDRWDLLLSDLTEADCVYAQGSGADSATAAPTSGLQIERGDGEDGPPPAPVGASPVKYPPPVWYVRPSPPEPRTQGMPDIDAAAAWLPRAAERVLLTDPASKINRVCSHVRSALLWSMAHSHPQVRSGSVQPEQVGPQHVVWQHPLVFSVVTSYARQSPADLEAILRIVQIVATAEAANRSCPVPEDKALPPAPCQAVTADAVLAHATMVCDNDVELLYTAALGCYDLMLAHAVSQRAGGMDPRETVPFLASLARAGQARQGEPPAPPLLGQGRAEDSSAWPMPPGTASILPLPSILPSGLLLFQPLASASSSGSDSSTIAPIQLSPGQVRQRFCIDVSLGRWARAVDWLAALALLHIHGRPEEPVQEQALVLALQTAMPVDTDSITAQALASPVTALASFIYTFGVHDRAMTVLTKGDGNTMALTGIRVLVDAVQAARGWWLLSGQWKPDRTGGLGPAAPTAGPLPRGALGQLFVSLCPSPYAPQAVSKPSLAGAQAALLGWMDAASSSGGKGAHLSSALAACVVHAGLAAGDTLCGHSLLKSGVQAVMHTLRPLVQGADDANAAAPSTDVILFGHLAVVIAQHVGIHSSQPTNGAHSASSSASAAAGRQSGSGSGSSGSSGGGRAGRVDLSALAAGTLKVKTLAEIEQEMQAEQAEMASAMTHGPADSASAQPVAATDASPAPLAPPGCTWPVLIRELITSLSKESAQECKLACARMQLVYVPEEDADEGVQALCECKCWKEAADRAAAASRPDLRETVVLPSLADAAAYAADDLATRCESALAALASLKKCRDIRASISLHELLGHASEEELYALLHERMGGEEGEGGDGDLGSIIDGKGMGGASVFSDASSVVSASWLTGGGSRVGGGGSVASHSSAGGSSVLSTLSQRSSKTAGVFSHWTRQNVSQTFADPRQSLRLAASSEGSGSGPSADRTEAEVTVAGLKQLDRAKRKQEKRDRPVKGTTPASGKLRGAGRFRPGSDSEQEHWEKELQSALLAPDHMQDVQSLLRTLQAFGLQRHVDRLTDAYSRFVQQIQGAPQPRARRDIAGEVRALAAALVGAPAARDEQQVQRDGTDPVASLSCLSAALL